MTPEDRSLSGVTLPKWMKTKITDKFDLEQNALSPPDYDEGFSYFRRSAMKQENQSKILTTIKEGNITVTQATPEKTDFSKHTPSCQKFINLSNYSDQSPNTQKNTKGKVKSNGVDDGFKGEDAKCGSSVIRFAHQIVIRDLRDNPDLKYFDARKRRGSKSLPASPMATPPGSPKTGRHINKYFTDSFVENDNSKSTWILSNLLSRSKLSQSVGSLGEEANEDLGASSYVTEKQKESKVLKAQPSELREMNFWSPTSM